MSSGSHGTSGHTAHSERPERSRNAKAQARHRAKRKAYIEQLEQTVTKLQTALGFSPEQASALPPPLIKIRELEQENARLHRENDDLRRMLGDTGSRGLPMDLDRRNSSSNSNFHDGRLCAPNERDMKRRKGNMEDAYMSPTDSQSHTGNDMLPRAPPPLTIPPHYSSIPSHHSSAHSGPTSSLYSLHAPAFQMPDTPSASSSTSSPPFSPAQMQHPSHSPIHHRPPSHHSLSNYSQSTNHYSSVKVEDEHYATSSHHSSNNYSLPSFSHTVAEHDMDTWHAYSSERAQLHR